MASTVEMRNTYLADICMVYEDVPCGHIAMNTSSAVKVFLENVVELKRDCRKAYQSVADLPAKRD